MVNFTLSNHYHKYKRMTQQDAAATTTPNRKQVRKEIAEKLNGALSDYKQEIGEKKLATHVKKVSKLIVRDIEKGSKKKKKDAKKTAPKSTPKAAGKKKKTH